MTAILDESAVSDTVLSKVSGPLREHQRLRFTLAGCPNACSQPQIADVGLIGQERPRLDRSACIGCGLCVDTCAEGAFDLSGGNLTLDDSLCVGCGACIRVCPTAALSAKSGGWKVVAGGRLGRHPRLATPVVEGASLDEALRLVRSTVGVWSREGRPNERVGATLDRLARSGTSSDDVSAEESRSTAVARLLLEEA